MKDYNKLSNIARGLEKAPLVFKNAKVVNVFSDEVISSDVAVCDGVIVAVGSFSGEKEIDLNGKYLLPSFIDSHLHIESSLVSPGEFIYEAAKKGTTTFIVDPHEAANVSGPDGIKYMLEATEDSPANVYFMLPSCVPATGIDDNGFNFSASHMEPFKNNPRILGLGEVMDYLSVINGGEEMHKKLRLFADRVIDGHAPFLPNNELDAYVLAGIKTNHETASFEYALEQIRRGVCVNIRCGSAARNLDELVSGIVKNGTPTENFVFCTDDKHIEDIRREGHINYCVKRAAELGLNPISAIKMATIGAAKIYGLRNIGAVAPGYQADLIIMDNLENQNILSVYHKGEEITEKSYKNPVKVPENLLSTVHLTHFDEKSLKINNEVTHVLGFREREITTSDIVPEKPIRENLENHKNYLKIASVERHKGTGLVGVGYASGFGLQGGAIASSVGHDSHNIVVIGSSDRDMAIAVNALIECGGGYCLVENGKIFDTLPLPIMGLMSDKHSDEINETVARMIKKAHEMGVKEGIDPFITLSFASLPVIPSLRILPRGLFSVEKFDFIK